jgi:myo-inositol 2-dehydrogenase/D-chiro-inositol 1-dehydrogenase
MVTTRDTLRFAMIGAGWISRAHLDALDRLGRTTLVGVASARLGRATAVAAPRGAAAYDDPIRMLDELRPDVAYVAVPPSSAIAICEALVERGIPFLAEKPLASLDAEGPARVAAAIEARGLVVAVGYHLRALDSMPEVRERLAANPAHLVTARWLDSTPGPAWWRREVDGGGQVVEQATHLYDLARLLVGEAEVVGAASILRKPVTPADTDVADATAAVLRFETGAVGSFANTRQLAANLVDVDLASEGVRTTIRRADSAAGGWETAFHEGRSIRVLPSSRDPYERQAEVFLDAVEAGDPSAVLSTYGDALKTHRLTRAVVTATGRRG